MATPASGRPIQVSATVALGANGGATDVGTWTHSTATTGPRLAAEKIEILDAVSRQPIGPAQSAPAVVGFPAAIVTTNSTTVIAVQNQSSLALNAVVRVTWRTPSAALGAQIPAASFVLT